ncbi:uncharacterized protein BO80DRAFT_157704 [Aspergillus ibericus CBS 121593]|uniref:BZIP domain-containing protein n=1 Tax=Aspergillus ibericus CBS 121593 TaxID=1448316 RepID=A0A395GTJ0_9EURO|nr:hypothetical protein BO80DRAFT_157704 [Aspergillus ibericus CBS 121593]RAK98504.1 hypothetical protein BO80DRAFT_157704 [Aspergillus ibericus CBS 121593]
MSTQSAKPAIERRSSRRSAGRPRLTEPGAAKLSETRRSQIRRAQKGYRERKEATVQKAQTLVAELEQRLSRIGELLQGYRITLQSILQGRHPGLVDDLDSILALLPTAPAEVMQASSGAEFPSREMSASVPRLPDHDECVGHCSNDLLASGQAIITQSCGTFDASPRSDVTCSLEVGQNSQRSAPATRSKHVRSVQPIVRSIGAHDPYTYSYLESSFTRRLKRTSLEHAFRIFSDPHAHPLEVFRLFRLVPCFRDRAKMYLFFRDLVSSPRGHCLEILSLPFYSVGGAGTHYRAVDQAGNPIYPSGARIPRRILGILPMAEASNSPHFADQSQSHRHLELCGFGGEWFDCQDVEGYLRARGVDIDGSSVHPLVAEVNPAHDGSSHYVSTFGSCTDDPGVSHTGSDVSASPRRSPHYVLDLEAFSTGLLRGMAILGRAPGFRRADVENTFQSALRRRV